MSEVLFNGPEGKLQGFYKHVENAKNIAIILHPRECFENSMDNNIVSTLFDTFYSNSFSTLKFNFRGVQKSQGALDDGTGELSDAASALDWLQTQNPDVNNCWISGVSFGAWVSSQLLMRRPEIVSFINVMIPINEFDFSFLSPCPASGLVVYGKKDELVPVDYVDELKKRLSSQRGIKVEFQAINDANHFFTKSAPDLLKTLNNYVKKESALF